MLIYFVVTIITIILYFFPKIIGKKIPSEIFFCLYFILLVLFGILRYGIGSDYKSYYNYFISGDFFNGKFEFAFSLLSYIIYYIFNNPYVYMGLLHMIIMIIIFYLIKKNSIDITLSILLFFYGFFYFDSLNIIRQYIAVEIAMLAIILFFKG